jgi:CheY-like chemotaxis protein
VAKGRNIILTGFNNKIPSEIMVSTANTDKKLKVLLVDDDQSFGYLMARVAKSMGVDLTHKVSLIELGSFAMIKNYDIAMIDFYLENLRGDEIAQYVDTFFNDIPIVIVSAHEFDDQSKSKWPPTVKAFLPKVLGPAQLLKRVIDTHDRVNFLRRFTGTTASPSP